jgi:hypothetical protein
MEHYGLRTLPLGGLKISPLLRTCSIYLQTIVFRYKEISRILCTKHLRNGTGIVSFHRIFRQGHNFSPMFRTQYIPDFFIADHYGLRNTSSWGPKDLALGFPPKLISSEFQLEFRSNFDFDGRNQNSDNQS